MVAVAAGGQVAPIAVLAPLCALLAVFAGERRRRLDHALELSRAYRGTALLLGDDDRARRRLHRQPQPRRRRPRARRRRAGSGWTATECRRLEFGALLHDIGKIAVPKEILHKPGCR